MGLRRHSKAEPIDRTESAEEASKDLRALRRQSDRMSRVIDHNDSIHIEDDFRYIAGG
jgi:hypothetical protein